MSPSPASNALRMAADAMHTAEEAADYLANPPPDGRFGIALEWSWGRSHERGYAAIRERVSRLINEQMDDLVQRAVREIYQEAEARKREAKPYLDR